MMSDDPKAVADAIRRQQAQNGCVAYFRATGPLATFPGAPCTPDCICAKKAGALARVRL